MKGIFYRNLHCRANDSSVFQSRSIAVLLLLIPISGCLFLNFQKDTFAEDENDPTVVRTIQAIHANVQHLEPILLPLLSETGSLSIDKRTNSVVLRDAESCVRSIKQVISKLDDELPSHTFHLKYAEADIVANQIKKTLGAAGKIVVPDERTRTVYVMASPTKLDLIKPLVLEWDESNRQVLIEADILDVSSAKLKELGIDWELRLGYGGGEHEAVINIGVPRASPDDAATGGVSFGTPSVKIPALFDPYGNLVTPAEIIPGSDFNAAIEALIEDSSTRTLSRPHIMVIDGQLARFEVSTMEPYANTHYNEHGSATSLDIQFMEIGIILETVPHISDDGFVTMEVRPEVSTLVREEFFETTVIPDEGGAIINSIRVPVKSQNRASTVIKVRDRQTIAIGGLRTREEIESIRKVPILGDIPILGVPFRNLNKGRGKRELIIFITPHIVSGEVSSPEAARLSQADISEDREEGSDVSSR